MLKLLTHQTAARLCNNNNNPDLTIKSVYLYTIDTRFACSESDLFSPIFCVKTFVTPLCFMLLTMSYEQQEEERELCPMITTDLSSDFGNKNTIR